MSEPRSHRRVWAGERGGRLLRTAKVNGDGALRARAEKAVGAFVCPKGV